MFTSHKGNKIRDCGVGRVLQLQLSEPQGEEIQARWELRHAPTQACYMGEHKPSQTSRYITIDILRSVWGIWYAEVCTAWAGQQRRPGVSCGWPFLPCQKPRVLSLSEPEVKVHGYTAKYRQTHVLLSCAPSQPAVRGLRPRSCAASGGAPSWLIPPAPGSRSVYLHLGTQPASMQKPNPSKKNGVCSFAQVNRLNSRPKQDRSFLVIANKALVPDSVGKMEPAGGSV